MKRIYFSWPTHWKPYLEGRSDTNPEFAFCMFWGLHERFESVTFLDWNQRAGVPLDSECVLISHGSWPVQAGLKTLDHIQDFLDAGAKWVNIVNDPLYNYTAGDGCYNLHGYDGFDNKGMYRCIPNGSHMQTIAEAKKASLTLCHANDVAIKLWRENHPSVMNWKNEVAGYDFRPLISPIDKPRFYREVFDSKKKKILLPNGPDFRKQPQTVWPMLDQDKWRSFGDTSYFIPAQYKSIVETCSIICHPSLQESFSYFLSETMCKGLLPIAGEDWFDGYGYEQLIWRQSADGSTMPANREKLLWLLSDSPEVETVYQEVIAHHWNRRDNSWGRWLDIIEDHIRGTPSKLGFGQSGRTSFLDENPWTALGLR